MIQIWTHIKKRWRDRKGYRCCQLSSSTPVLKPDEALDLKDEDIRELLHALLTDRIYIFGLGASGASELDRFVGAKQLKEFRQRRGRRRRNGGSSSSPGGNMLSERNVETDLKKRLLSAGVSHAAPRAPD